ncbi:MAG: hypothetical protein HY958_00990 [Bacteroidia bacterium]|nr:hypothetical protein [Bacteroidia bacterium]
MTGRINNSIFIFYFYMISPFACFAQLPLITDNAGIQGKGKGQFEISNGVGFHNEHRCIENSSEILPVFTYGLNDKCDIVLCYVILFFSPQLQMTPAKQKLQVSLT